MKRYACVTTAIGLVAVAACSIALPGCAPPREAAAPPSATAETRIAQPAASRAATDAQLLGIAVQSWILDPHDFSDEPKGDVATDGLTRVYAHISDVSTSPASVSFDVGQLYFGASAVKQAAIDHQPTPETDLYERNLYQYVQRLPVVDGAGVVGSFGGQNDAEYGLEGWARFTPLTFAEFATRYAAMASNRRSAEGYWLTISPDGITSIVQQYRD